MNKEIKNTIHVVRNGVQFDAVDNTSTSLLRIGGAFLFASIQPFNWLCDFIDIKKLREVIFKIVYDKSMNNLLFSDYYPEPVEALMPQLPTSNRIIIQGERLGLKRY